MGFNCQLTVCLLLCLNKRGLVSSRYQNNIVSNLNPYQISKASKRVGLRVG